jgi:hypothetical protein
MTNPPSRLTGLVTEFLERRSSIVPTTRAGSWQWKILPSVGLGGGIGRPPPHPGGVGRACRDQRPDDQRRRTRSSDVHLPRHRRATGDRTRPPRRTGSRVRGRRPGSHRQPSSGSRQGAVGRRAPRRRHPRRPHQADRTGTRARDHAGRAEGARSAPHTDRAGRQREDPDRDRGGAPGQPGLSGRRLLRPARPERRSRTGPLARGRCPGAGGSTRTADPRGPGTPGRPAGAAGAGHVRARPRRGWRPKPSSGVVPPKRPVSPGHGPRRCGERLGLPITRATTTRPTS